MTAALPNYTNQVELNLADISGSWMDSIGSGSCEICAFAAEHHRWPMAAGTHCRDCHRSWVSTAQAHCTVCCGQFASNSVADLHRESRRANRPSISIRISSQGSKSMTRRWVLYGAALVTVNLARSPSTPNEELLQP